ncbi:hypothetical protein [Ilumatobacter sp.]|uniref:hypothetical protein n=1 Tax=Ilumatobacter sp. TaxID=1967498 RepID=UPI003B522F39
MPLFRPHGSTIPIKLPPGTKIEMARKVSSRNGTTTRDLAILASNVGLVQDTDAGRQAFEKWFAEDPAVARQALFSQVRARRVAASSPTPSNDYPSNWRPGVRATEPSATTQYPSSWRRAAGIGGRRKRITTARD